MLPRTTLDCVPVPDMAACALAASATNPDGTCTVDMVSRID